MSESENNSHEEEEESEEEISSTESLIRERSKVFNNEKDAIRILLSDHFKKSFSKFFSNVKNTYNSVYQSIKQEIRNCLNPYRIWLKNKNNILENDKEFKDLYESLKRYYKDKNFNNVFFINYFTDLKEAQNAQPKSKFVKFLPKNEIETLNDIERKVETIKRLKSYLFSNIKDRLQINYQKYKENFNEDEFTMMYKYLVIKPDKYSSMDEKKLFENIISRKSQRLRRPLNDINYNYLPIFCKGHCKKEADLFIQHLLREIVNNHKDCQECFIIRKNIESIQSQIRSLYLKTCIFSHNIEEILFHPLYFLSFENNANYNSVFQKSEKNIDIDDELTQTKTIPTYYLSKRKFPLRKIFNDNNESMKEIFQLLQNYSNKINLFGGSCFMPEIKTKKCPLDLFKPDKKDLINHMKRCPFYHNELEKRRTKKIIKNKICPNVLINGRWKDDISLINCKNGENCQYFHTRNELFYDERNFRKLYTCNNEYFRVIDSLNFCPNVEICPRKHPIDIKINEIYLPSEQKRELERELTRLKQKGMKLNQKMKTIKKIECNCCLNYIDGKENRNFVFFRNCHHIICTKCYELYKFCPICGLKPDEDMVIIYLDINNNIKNEESEESEHEDENESIDKEESNESNEINNNNDDDDEIIDSENKDDINEKLFKENEDGYFSVSYSSNMPDITMNNNTKTNKNIKKKNDDEDDDESDEDNKKDDDDDNDNTSSLSNPSFNQSNIREKGGRGRGARGGRGRGGRGDQGRGRGRGRGNRGRGYNRNINNSFEDENENSDANNTYQEETSMRNDRGRTGIRGRVRRGRGRGRGNY